MHNRMLNTRSRANTVSISEVYGCDVEPSFVVEHTSYNPARSRRQLNQPPLRLAAGKDPAPNVLAGPGARDPDEPRHTRATARSTGELRDLGFLNFYDCPLKAVRQPSSRVSYLAFLIRDPELSNLRVPLRNAFT